VGLSILVIVPKFCTIPPFNIFSIFTKRHKFHFPTFLSNLLTHGAYVMRDVKLCW